MAKERPETDDGGVATELEKTVKRPTLYRVLLHNDDYTTQEFVVYVLMSVFHHSPERAYEIMMHVHTRGIGVAGLYPYETAEAKTTRVNTLAQENEYPLKCSMEPE